MVETRLAKERDGKKMVVMNEGDNEDDEHASQKQVVSVHCVQYL